MRVVVISFKHIIIGLNNGLASFLSLLKKMASKTMLSYNVTKLEMGALAWGTFELFQSILRNNASPTKWH